MHAEGLRGIEFSRLGRFYARSNIWNYLLRTFVRTVRPLEIDHARASSTLSRDCCLFITSRARPRDRRTFPSSLTNLNFWATLTISKCFTSHLFVPPCSSTAHTPDLVLQLRLLRSASSSFTARLRVPEYPRSTSDADYCDSKASDIDLLIEIAYGIDFN